jgi:hypothetical protein
MQLNCSGPRFPVAITVAIALSKSHRVLLAKFGTRSEAANLPTRKTNLSR